MLASRDADDTWHVPAAPADIVDVTGCGNAYNGALLAALQAGCTLDDAGAWGSAAASCMAEATGMLPETEAPCLAYPVLAPSRSVIGVNTLCT